MGRKALPETREQISGRVPSAIKKAVDAIAKKDERTVSQTVERLLKESPRVKAELRNGKKR